MKKNIYVKEDVLKEAVDYLNDEMTFFGFLSHVKFFLKQLLTNPLYADIDEYLKRHGIERKDLLNKCIERGIVEKETRIEGNDGKDKFSISYKIPKRNFERKIKRLYMTLFEQDDIISEDGATSCGSVMQGGGLNPDAGQYTKPFSKVQRRKIYITNEQAEMLKEMTTHDAGDYQYDVPFKFNDGKDPAYDHKNMISKGIPNKKKGVRRKKK